ncbi:MAG: MalM family protein [Pseudomonadales bacterium]|nr:MalM family protein [Pseudomonadales bacterium]
MHKTALLLIALVIAGCQGRPDSGGFYVYTDAQGNLVTLDRPPQAEQESRSRPESTGSQNSAAEAVESDDTVEQYRPSDEVDAELEARERDRFITYVDETGQLVSRPVDMVEAKEATASREPGYSQAPSAGYLETYRALRADCCRHLLEQAEELESGSERVVSFGSDSQVMVGDTPYRAVALAPASGADTITLRAFIRKQGYLAVELLWLDEKGEPVLLVDQPFSRRYPETWYRYGYLEGTLQREAGQRYLVVFLPYTENQPGTDGLTRMTSGELVLLATSKDAVN